MEKYAKRLTTVKDIMFKKGNNEIDINTNS